MKIVVTGANGQLGLSLQDLFQLYPHADVFFLDRKQLPLEQTMIIQDILAMYEPDVIIHCAAYTAVDKAESEPVLADQINHLACEEIAQYCRIHGTRLLAVSTDYVFDGTSSIPLAEDAPVGPLNTYGETKLRGEQAIQKWHPEAIIIRTSWVYSSHGHNFVKTMLRLMSERTELSVIQDQIGSPTYARDLAAAILTIVMGDKWVPGIYNYSNIGAISWYDFAVAIRDIRGLACTIHAIPSSSYPTPARRPSYSLLDKTKIQAIYGVAVPFWEDSLKHCLQTIGDN